MNRARPAIVTILRELAFDAGSPFIVALNMLHTITWVVILCNAMEVCMSKIGNYVLECEERGEMFFNEESLTYEFRNQTECGHESSSTGRNAAVYTVGRDVLVGRLRHTRHRRQLSKQVKRSKKFLQTLARPANRRRARVLHRQARRGRGYFCARLLQKGAEAR